MTLRKWLFELTVPPQPPQAPNPQMQQPTTLSQQKLNVEIDVSDMTDQEVQDLQGDIEGIANDPEESDGSVPGAEEANSNSQAPVNNRRPMQRRAQPGRPDL